MLFRISALLLISLFILHKPLSAQSYEEQMKLLKKDARAIEKAAPIKGWTMIPSGTLRYERQKTDSTSTYIQRPNSIAITTQAVLFKEQEVSVREYNQFLDWIDEAAFSLKEQLIPKPPTDLGVPADYYTASKYKHYPALGLTAFQMAHFCSWVDFVLRSEFLADKTPASYSEFIDTSFFWSTWYSVDNEDFLGDHFSFSFARPVHLSLTEHTTLYAMHINDGKHVFSEERSYDFLQDAEQFSEIVPVDEAIANDFGLRGSYDNAAEVLKIIAFPNPTIDTTTMRLEADSTYHFEILRMDSKLGFFAVRGLEPQQAPQLLFLDQAAPPKLYGFRLIIQNHAYFPPAYERGDY